MIGAPGRGAEGHRLEKAGGGKLRASEGQAESPHGFETAERHDYVVS